VLFKQTSSPSAETAASRGKVWNLDAWRIDAPYDFKRSLPEIAKSTQTPIREYMAVLWECEMSKTIMDVLERNCTTLNTIYSRDLEEMRSKPGKIAEEIGRLKPGPINAQITSPGSPEAKQNFEMRIKVLLFLYANANSTLLELTANPEPTAVRDFNRMDAFASEVVAWPKRTPLLAVHEFYRSSIESKLDHATEGEKTEAELRKAVVGLAPAYKSSLALDLITVLSLVASVPQLSIALEEPDKLASKSTVPKSPKTPEYQPPYVLCGGTPQLLYLEPKNAELKPYQPAMEEYINLTMKWTYSFIRAMNIVLCLPEDSSFVNDLKPPSKSLAGAPKIEMERYEGLACGVGVIEKILDTYKPGTTVPVIDASFRNKVKEAFKSQVGEGKPFASDGALEQMIAVGAREKWLPLVLLMGAPGVPKNCLGRLKEFNQVFEREGPAATPGIADVVKKVTLYDAKLKSLDQPTNLLPEIAGKRTVSDAAKAMIEESLGRLAELPKKARDMVEFLGNNPQILKDMYDRDRPPPPPAGPPPAGHPPAGPPPAVQNQSSGPPSPKSPGGEEGPLLVTAVPVHDLSGSAPTALPLPPGPAAALPVPPSGPGPTAAVALPHPPAASGESSTSAPGGTQARVTGSKETAASGHSSAPKTASPATSPQAVARPGDASPAASATAASPRASDQPNQSSVRKASTSSSSGTIIPSDIERSGDGSTESGKSSPRAARSRSTSRDSVFDDTTIADTSSGAAGEVPSGGGTRRRRRPRKASTRKRKKTRRKHKGNKRRTSKR
jgi:hypothetical protein